MSVWISARLLAGSNRVFIQTCTELRSMRAQSWRIGEDIERTRRMIAVSRELIRTIDAETARAWGWR